MPSPLGVCTSATGAHVQRDGSTRLAPKVRGRFQLPPFKAAGQFGQRVIKKFPGMAFKPSRGGKTVLKNLGQQASSFVSAADSCEYHRRQIPTVRRSSPEDPPHLRR